jgi:hypothetical protein
VDPSLLASINESLKEIKQSMNESIREVKQDILDINQRLDRLSYSGRAYESTYRIALIKDLYNESKGLIISASYYQPNYARRLYSRSEHGLIFQKCIEQLRANNWDEEKLKFESVEIDCLLRCYYPDKEIKLSECVSILDTGPDHRLVVQPDFSKKQISDPNLETEDSPNCYALAEITSEASQLDRKLDQLEKDLLITLLRCQLESSEDILIENLFQIVLIVLPNLPRKQSDMDSRVRDSLIARKFTHPLLFRLFQIGRFACYCKDSHLGALMANMADHVSSNQSQICLQAAKEDSENYKIGIKKEQLRDAKLARLTTELRALASLPQTTKVKDKITEYHREIEEMIFVNDE